MEEKDLQVNTAVNDIRIWMGEKDLQANTAVNDIRECLEEICEWMETAQSVLYRMRKDISYLKNKKEKQNVYGK
jgi:hypothetical protein